MREKTGKIDLRLLSHITNLLMCSRCLRAGVRMRVRQLVSAHHRPQPLCRECREADAKLLGYPRTSHIIRLRADTL